MTHLPPDAEGWRPRKRRHPFASPLTRRILAVNLLAPIILLAGLLSFDRYKQGLLQTELDGLTTQAEMIAGAVGEGAVFEGSHDAAEMNRDIAQQMVRRLSEQAQLRARLFDAAGELVADSRLLLSRKGVILIEDLAPPRDPGLAAAIVRAWDRLSTWMPQDASLPPYTDSITQQADHYSEAVTALSGKSAQMVRSRNRSGLMLSVAVPVQRYKQVVGALMVSADGSGVARSLFRVRLAIVEIFAVTLLITIGVSLYMAGTIARPIRRLALAAEQVRRGHGRGHAIPDLSARGDEIGELSAALKDMTEALWRRMDAIEAFAADVAHEIKNPLTSVRSAVETAARITDPGQKDKLMAIIKDDVERLNRLITDISDASRLDAELSRAQDEPVRIADMIVTLAEVYRATTEERRLNFVIDVPPQDPLVVSGVEGRLVQVLRNLIGNAVSFSPDGGTIALSARREGAWIRLMVEDDGPGIPANKLDAIFERFYSERPQGEKFGTHSGLGLSISKQIVEAHDGRIRAENRSDGPGARFVAELPAAPFRPERKPGAGHVNG